jgi:hypothetical protein
MNFSLMGEIEILRSLKMTIPFQRIEEGLGTLTL